MLIATLLVLRLKRRNNLNDHQEWINNLWYSHTMEHHTEISMNGLELHVLTWESPKT